MLATAVTFSSIAQGRYTISGNIVDATNGEGLIGATVLIKELGTGGVTNEYGFYSVTLPEGEYTLSVSYVGYETITQDVQLYSFQDYLVFYFLSSFHK